MNTSLKNRIMTSVLVGLVTASVTAADLTVEKGSPHAVSANETYTKILASDKIIINDGKTLKANSYALQSDAAADDFGRVDAVRIGAGSTFYSPTITSANAATGVIVFAGTGAKIDRSSDNSWGSTLFSSGNWELADETGTGINFSLPTAWSGGNLNAAGVGVRLTGSGNIVMSAGFTTTRSQGLMNLNRGFAFANNGKVTFTSTYYGTYVINADDVFQPSVTGVYVSRSNYKEAPVTLKIESGKTASVKNLVAYDGGSCDGAGTVRMGEGDSDGTLKVKIEGSGLTIEKVGTGTLSVPICNKIPSLVVKGGTVVLSAEMPVGKLSVAEGAAVTVDGVTVAVSEADKASQTRVSCVNGGKLVISKGGDGDVYLRDAITFDDDKEFLKIGSGRAILCSDLCENKGIYHVQGGQILFSKRGLADKYLKFTFKKVLGWINYFSVLQSPGYLHLKQIALFNVNGGRTCHRAADAFWYNAAHNGYSANKLGKGEISVNEGTTFASSYDGNWRCTPEGLFYTEQGDWPVFNTHKLNDADDPTTWQEVTVHLQDNVDLLDGYSFQANYCDGLPTTWTIESSATGTDGTWRTIADEANVQFEAAKKNHNAGWLDGYAANGDGRVTDTTGRLAMYFNYIVPGVGSASGSGATVELENEAVLDASNISAGLLVKKIVYDCTLGGGTLKNVQFVPSGVLEIVNASGSRRPSISIAVTDPIDAENLKTWQVEIDGKVSSSGVAIVDGEVVLQPSGLLLIVR